MFPQGMLAQNKILLLDDDEQMLELYQALLEQIPSHPQVEVCNSGARAIAMLEILASRYQIPRTRMAVAGYAENAAADTNDTDEGRAHNRRVDVVLLTVEGLRSEPGGGP